MRQFRNDLREGGISPNLKVVSKVVTRRFGLCSVGWRSVESTASQLGRSNGTPERSKGSPGRSKGSPGRSKGSPGRSKCGVAVAEHRKRALGSLERDEADADGPVQMQLRNGYLQTWE
jgi:hypothetical protein